MPTLACMIQLLLLTGHAFATAGKCGGHALKGRSVNNELLLHWKRRLVLCQVLSGRNSPLAGGGQASFMLSRGGSVGALKKNLSQRRAAYLTTGQLSTDAAVLAYMQRLEEHRKMCEVRVWRGPGHGERTCN